MWSVFTFECRYQIRSPLFWSVAAVFFLLAFFAMVSDNVSVGGSGANLNVNASYVIVQMQMVFSVLGLFAATAFVAGAITRDYEAKTAEIFFATGISESSYLLGRFWGGYAFSLLVMVAGLLGILCGALWPGLDAERLGPFDWAPYAFGLIVFLVPNAFIISTLFFAIAALTRSMLAAYLAALAFMITFILLSALVDPETLSDWAIVEPFGSTAWEDQTRYWTLFERNHNVPEFGGVLLQNRLLWLCIGALALFSTALRYRFDINPRRFSWRRSAAKDVAVAMPPQAALPLSVTPEFSSTTAGHQYLSQLRMDIRAVITSVPFYVLLAFGAINLLGGLNFLIGSAYGTEVYPVTNVLLRAAAGSFSLIVLLVIVYYSGELVQREQQAGVAQIVHASPYPNWIMILSKVTALWFIVVALLLVVAFVGVVVQLVHGYTNLQPGLLLFGLLVVLGASYYIMAALAVVLQTLLNHKMLGMLCMILLVIGLNYLFELGFEHVLYTFDTPSVPHSDLNGFGHFLTPFYWLSAYWFTFCLLLIVLGHLFFPRGITSGWRSRLATARQRFSGAVKGTTAGVATVFALLGGYIFYNTNVLNDYNTNKMDQQTQADYEITYKSFAGKVQLDPTAIDMQVDLYPSERRLESRGTATVVNGGKEPLSEFILSVSPEFGINQLTIQGARQTEYEPRFGVIHFVMEEPLPIGGVSKMNWDLTWANEGFKNSGSSTQVVHNGTFVNNFEIMPIPGYDAGRELQNPNDRRKFELPEIERLPKLGDPESLSVNQLRVGRRTQFRATFSTSDDQIAVAPGYLQEMTEADGRRTYVYEMDEPIWPFFSFVSARYEVAKDNWNDVALEVYYHKDHAFNVPTMLQASKDSLEYFSEVFSPYQYRQFRILEFPRYASFAQSFPNTIPYSESIGFIANLSDPKEINYVYYVTAHEAAHQWWAHQVIGAQMQGATVIVETMAQYSALMVMEKKYGADKMRRFLKFELDNYLKSRGGELIEELPLVQVENQGYIHYRKGSVVMYAIKQALGEDAVNRALQRFIVQHGMQEAPFPTAADLVAELRKEAAPEHQSLITDLFEKITIFDLAVDDVQVVPVGSEFDVTLTVSATKYYADGSGQETEAPFEQKLMVAAFGPDTDELGEDDLPTPLLAQEVLIKSGQQQVTLRVAEKPYQVGVDPYIRMIDRNPDNNLRRL